MAIEKRLLFGSFVTGLTLIILLGTQAVQAAEESYKAFYGIEANVGLHSSVIRTSSVITFGTAINHQFGEYQLSLLFEADETEQYTLVVSLNLHSQGSSIIGTTILRDVFTGRVSTRDDVSQSVFTIDEENLDISIAVRLSKMTL